MYPGPVVQLNRTSDSGSESRGFESLRGHLDKKKKEHTQEANYDISWLFVPIKTPLWKTSPKGQEIRE